MPPPKIYKKGLYIKYIYSLLLYTLGYGISRWTGTFGVDRGREGADHPEGGRGQADVDGIEFNLIITITITNDSYKLVVVVLT